MLVFLPATALYGKKNYFYPFDLKTCELQHRRRLCGALIIEHLVYSLLPNSLLIYVQKEHRDKCREHEQLKRLCVKQKEDLAFFRSQLEERDRLIEVHFDFRLMNVPVKKVPFALAAHIYQKCLCSSCRNKV